MAATNSTFIRNWKWPISSSWAIMEPNSNISESSEEEEGNLSNYTNYSGLSAESSYGLESANSAKEFIGDSNQNWTQILIQSSVGSSQGLHMNTQDVGEDLLDASSQKNIPSGLIMFDPTYDYSKKVDKNSFELLSSTSFNNFEKQLINVVNDSSFEALRNSKSSNLGRNWAVASYGTQVIDHQINDFRPFDNITILHPMEDGSSSNLCRGRKQSFGSISCFELHDVKMDAKHGETDFIESNNFGYNSHGTSSKTWDDYISSGSYPNRPLLDIKKFPSPKLICNPLSRNNRSTQGLLNIRRKKRKSQENSESVLKKPKQEANSMGSSPKVPKFKLIDKITALQQIVSPFGKTDTASVLWETIGYIRFLQEQIKLHSSPYLKGTNGRKDFWQGLERKNRGEVKLDLKSRGLCVIPVSCTPQIYRENNGSDYLSPPYRGCLYR